MKSVVICGSRKFKPEIRKWVRALKKAGIIVYEPFLTNYDWKEIGKKDKLMPKILATGLTLHHFEAIRKADVCFIYNKGGYMGNSVTLEMGAAAVLGKPIYTLEPDKELCREALSDGSIKTVKGLIKLLKK